MTYKEAKETIKSNYPPSHYSMLQEALDMAMEEFDKAEKYGWHDLRKNPDDLPNKNPNRQIEFCIGGFYFVTNVDFFHEMEEKADAWREIEQFEVNE